MSKKKRNYPAVYKRNAVKFSEEKQNVAKAGRDLGIGAQLIHRVQRRRGTSDVDKNHDTKRSPKRPSGEQVKQRFCEFTNQRVVATEDDKRIRRKKH